MKKDIPKFNVGDTVEFMLRLLKEQGKIASL